MREKIMDFASLSDSKEMLESRTPVFISFFILIIILMISGGLLWMWFGEIDIVVRAPVIVRPSETISDIYSAGPGVLKEVNYYTGKKIQQGDLLYLLEDDYYLQKYNYYLRKKERLVSRNDNLCDLKKSIQTTENLIDSRDAYFNYRYLLFTSRYRQLELDFQKSEKKYYQEKKLNELAASNSYLQKLKDEKEHAEINLNSFVNENLVNIKNEIRANQEEVELLQQQIREIAEKLNSTRQQAPVSGIIQVVEEFNPGDYLPAGTLLCRIIPQGQQEYQIDLKVKNEDIGKLQTGQQIRYIFFAFPYREYGSLTGEISKIDSDISMKNVSIDLERNYRVEGTIADDKLYNRRGESARLRAGMMGEARIVIDRKKILYVLLEKIDFIS